MRRYVPWVLAIAAFAMLAATLWTLGADAQSVIKGVTQMRVYSATLSPTVTSANTTAEQTFTVPGLRVGEWVAVNKPTVQAGLALCGARVTAANTLGICFGNLTGSTITPTASQVYTIFGVRS